MAFKTKTDLKEVFNGLSSLYFSKTSYDLDRASNTGYVNNSAPVFSSSTSYKVGDIVKVTAGDAGGAPTYSYYECISAGTASAVTDTTKFKKITDNVLNIDWEYDLPVTVDSIEISQDDPTINHYKVIGLQGDWTSSAQAGDFSVKFTVPTKHSDVIKLAFGDDAYKVIEGAKMTGGESDGTWNGSAVTVKMNKVTGTIGLLDEEKKNFMLISNIALYAKPMYQNASTEPFAIEFSGSIETSGDSNFAWLKKS